jgi:hypothetical protein
MRIIAYVLPRVAAILTDPTATQQWCRMLPLPRRIVAARQFRRC